ncbi:MAG TPA: DUF885 domain-containing protein [Acidimicrobiales bacterium]|nr:DUF885 domain-containing protein [Acidimicrobiales bacterium]
MPEVPSHRTAVFAVADRFVDDWCALHPIAATYFGVPGRDRELDDYSPAGTDRSVELVEAALEAFAALEPVDDDDRLALAVATERMASGLDLDRSGEAARAFGVIFSPAMEIRQVFEMMATEDAEGADAVRARLEAVPLALARWRETLEAQVAAGQTAARRHATGVAAQMREIADAGFPEVAARAARAAGVEAVASGLEGAAGVAGRAFGELADWLDGVYAPASDEAPFVGRECYARWARHYTGLDLDLEETYAWGWEELARINARMDGLAEVLAPGAASLTEVAERLDRDPRYVVHGTDELLARLRAFTDATVERLAGREFTIDERIRFCDVRLAPEGSAAAPYYLPPSEDLSRPGTTWFPTLGKEEFAWWRQVTTWYHEAVPGHHLEEGTVVLNAHRLTRYQRLMAWNSGWGEGWALYAERLMDELGGFEEPAYEMGYLMSQALRAARVVVDIGLHLQLPAPKDFGRLDGLGEVGGVPWTPEMAVATLVERALEPPDFARSEVERYLAIPGQAISYKVGEREWVGAREEMRAARGADFSLRDFHDRALALGPIGLGAFREALRRG